MTDGNPRGKSLLERKKKWTYKGNDMHKDADLSYTIQVVLNVCNKFQNPW